ncbi:MAG: NAD-dependent epimerase/dehydratase family protein [Spirosomataceae bacterium]
MKTVFVTGGTGYIGSRLIKELLRLNCTVIALVRAGSEHQVPLGCQLVYGNALDSATYQEAIPQGCTFVHLVGVAHPSPAKKQQFIDIDLRSIHEAVNAVREAQVGHFVYLSVAQYPSGLMQTYQDVRAEGEQLIRTLGVPATFVRPWYVVGPGHYWPLLLKPLYRVLKLFHATRQKAIELDLVSLEQVITALIMSILVPPVDAKVLKVADLKQISRFSQPYKIVPRLVLS